MNAYTIFTKIVNGDKATRVLAGLSAMDKKASASSDLISHIGWSAVPWVGAAANAGSVIGAIEGAPLEEEEAEMDRNPITGALPGVGSYRTTRRLKKQMTDDKGSSKHFWSSIVGPGTSMIAPIILGAALGYTKDPGFRGNRDDNAAIGALIGGIGSLAAGSIGGGIAALASRRRTKEEQAEAAKGGTLANLLIPGVAQYNEWKALGRSLGDSQERLHAPKEQKLILSAERPVDDERIKALIQEALANQKTASLHKEALQTVNDVKAKAMKKMHVGDASIKNYADQRDANGPAIYNPIDWLMNWKRYVRNDLQFEKNREMLMNRSNDRYWKQMDELAKRQATPPQGK